MKNRDLYIAAIVFTALTVAAFTIALVPVVLVVLLAVLACFIAGFALIVFLFGGFIGLIAYAENESVLNGAMDLCVSSFELAGGIFDILPPMVEFCVSERFSTICLGIGIAFGIVAIILTAILVTGSWSSDTEKPEKAQEIHGIEKEGTPQKKRKPKKKRTERGISNQCLILSCAFTALCVHFIMVLEILLPYLNFPYSV